MPPVMVIGEAYGVQEERASWPFVGPSGIELIRMLSESRLITSTEADGEYLRRYYNHADLECAKCIWKLHADEVYPTNVFNFHPPANELDNICGPKSDAIYGFPALNTGKYVRAEFTPELERLAAEIETVRPNLILALGNTALWALCGTTKISALRGSTRYATHCGAGIKILPTYHPAAIIREWSNRSIAVADMMKARREKEFPDVRRPQREIWTEPSLEDIRRFIDDHIRGARLLSVDIETSGTRVTCIGFAPRTDLALVVPFDDPRAADRSYWNSRDDERRAVQLIKEILEDHSVPKLFQNGAGYDIPFLWRSLGIRTYGAGHDTMLLSHALQPEMQKGLGFLGSIYAQSEGAWKTERGKTKTIKRDE